MSTALPEIVAGENLSEVWGRIFLALMAPGSDTRPVLMSLNGMVDNVAAELEPIRTALDDALSVAGECSCKITANTIFPYNRWRRNPDAAREQLYEWYLQKFLPRAKARDGRNRYGTYFERLVRATGTRHNRQSLENHETNQLEHVIGTWAAGIAAARRPRRSSLQLACFDPVKDHTGQILRGFPCMQQVSFSYDNDGGISVTAYYPTQYIFERAYGNYLGLCHLGEFVADALDVRFVRLNCLTLQPTLGTSTKTSLRPLEATVRAELSEP